jgi:hypothetical protein
MPDGDAKRTAREAIAGGPLPRLLSALQRVLLSNPNKGGFFGGDSLTVGDLKVYNYIVSM